MAMSFLFSPHYLEMLLLVLFLILFFFCFGRLLSIAEETLAEFLSKATGTAVDWVQMPGMKVFFFFLFEKEIYFLRNHFLVYASSNDIAYFFTLEPELTKQFFNSLVSLVRIRLGSLPFPKVATEWQLELVVL